MFNSFEKLPQEKRESIINAGMDAFIRNGYLKANTVEIAKECGIAKGSLFHYFESKKALFIYIVWLCARKVIKETRESLLGTNERHYFERVRKSAAVKIAIPLKLPRETALLARVFSEQGHDASSELHDMAVKYAADMRELNSRYIGEIEPELIKENITHEDAKVFIQTVFDGITARLLKQYAKNPGELLDKPEILSIELEKAISFILYGIGM